MLKPAISKGARNTRDFILQLSGVQIPAFAAYASFFLILAIFPVVMLLLSLIKLTPLSQSDYLSMVNELSPKVLKSLLNTISGELFAKLSGAFLGITGLTAVWSASRCMLGLISGLNAVYRVNETRNYFIKRLIAVFYMLFFVVSLLVLLLFHVFWQLFVAMAEKYFVFSFPILVTVLRFALSLALLTALFMLVFKVFPNRKARFRTQFPGALLAAAGWMVFTYLFSIYVNNFSNYSFLYGSLTTIVLAMLWMYFCMTILFIGGSVNAFLEKLRQEQI